MKRRDPMWNVDYPPQAALTRWAEKEVEIALRAIRKDHFFSWGKNVKDQWRITFSFFDFSIEIDKSPKALIDEMIELKRPGHHPNYPLDATDFSRLDAFADHLQWLATYASNRINRMKTKAGLIP